MGYSKNTFFLLLFVLCIITTKNTYAQKRTYELNLLRAVEIDNTEKKGALLIFYITTKKPADFPPILSMRMTYSVDGSKETTVDMQKDGNIQIVIYGDDIDKKGPNVYKLIKDRIDINQKKEFLIMAIYLNDLCEKPINKMTATYGLWEKRKERTRVETKYEFTVDH